MRPKLLDLFCCEGGASRGYDRAGFDVYGVDLFGAIKGGFSRRRYPYPALVSDAVAALDTLLDGDPLIFDNRDRVYLDQLTAIHASPPCQHASAGTRAIRARSGGRYPALIEPTRDRLMQTGLPYVIENVSGSALRDPVTLCGTQFGLTATDDDGTPLEMWRHRLFETNWHLSAPGPCRHGHYSTQVAGSYGGARRDKAEARHVRHGRLRARQARPAGAARHRLDDRARHAPVAAARLHRPHRRPAPRPPRRPGGSVTSKPALALDTNPAAQKALDALGKATRDLSDIGRVPPCHHAPHRWELPVRASGRPSVGGYGQRDAERRDFAARLCAGCPLLEPCRHWGIASRDGQPLVIGGLTPEDRLAARSRKRAAA